MKVTTNINEIFSKTEVELTYKNTSQNSVELIIEIPIRDEIIFNYFIAKIDNKIIKSKVIENNKAEEKYNDAIASGNTGITSTYNSYKKICSLKIGNLQKKETLELKFYFIQFVTIQNSFYCINLIKEFPTISQFNYQRDLKGKIIIETISKITDLMTKYEDKSINCFYNYSNEKKKCEIKYSHNCFDKILFKTSDLGKPLLISQYNNRLNETNYILNYYINNNSHNNRQYPCLFIILIDQSGSMYDTIKSVSIALEKLINSLPEDSFYQLIGYGDNYEVYNKLPEKNTNENINRSKEIISNLNANLGGTDLSKPLYYILRDSYSDYKDINLSKQIIVLTDGDINIGDDIIDLIKLHNNEFRIHCIGIGNQVNRELIIKTSIVGNGTYHFISDSTELNEKVFEILKDCKKEYINNYKFILNDKSYELQPVNKTTYDKESLNYCFFQKGKEKNDISIEFIWENLKEKFKKNIEFKFEEIIKLPEGEELSKLIMGLSLKYDFINNEEEQTKLSKLYQVLCKYTTLYAEIEGDKSIKDKMNTFTQKYSIKKIKEYSHNYDYNLSFRSRPQSLSSSFSSSFRESSRLYAPKHSYSKKPRKNSISLLFGVCCLLIIILIIYFIIKLIK